MKTSAAKKQPLLRLFRTSVAAPGNRNRGSGELTNVGNNGYSWSSAVGGTGGLNGLFLNFNTQNLNPSNADNRAYGLQVRCLQAFIGHPVFISPLGRKSASRSRSLSQSPGG